MSRKKKPVQKFSKRKLYMVVKNTSSGHDAGTLVQFIDRFNEYCVNVKPILKGNKWPFSLSHYHGDLKEVKLNG